MPLQLADLKAIGSTESQHVSFLQSALAQSGVAPVRRCEYDFSAALADPAAMLATAAVLEVLEREGADLLVSVIFVFGDVRDRTYNWSTSRSPRPSATAASCWRFDAWWYRTCRSVNLTAPGRAVAMLAREAAHRARRPKEGILLLSLGCCFCRLVTRLGIKMLLL
jgi:hypothetical protein